MFMLFCKKIAYRGCDVYFDWSNFCELFEDSTVSGILSFDKQQSCQDLLCYQLCYRYCVQDYHDRGVWVLHQVPLVLHSSCKLPIR